MDFWTFITIIVIIFVFRDTLRNIFKSFLAHRLKEENKKEIDELRRRLNEVEKYPGIEIEKRLQAVESIVVDPEYDLKMKFKKLLEKK